MILSDNEIRSELVARNCISPASERVDKPDVTYSYGIGPAGYDARLDTAFRLATGGTIFDPEKFTLAPFQSVLCCTHEWFHIPPYLCGKVWGKSSLARQFILVNATPLEPGWSGQITLEVSNLGPFFVELYVKQGICQVQFERLSSPTSIPYKGRYQDQVGVTPFLPPEQKELPYPLPPGVTEEYEKVIYLTQVQQ